ncbi:DNA ligase D [Amycolatopsis acidiphila]|uniref:DNA ligase (ATP) n=1 Tax=Amycolatopsis acidiphila TaxID=715473 RepID=A0A558A2Y1_9PSEU|nr:DNA ligase D [Amycolatopsis acidiphila]TVT18612.1 DNA ligase D [Amycolatopsis acidiphila]UIJ56593.1 DNA ligase D [Amycolatopsis acidiphila]GHG66492.1 DNA ligase D [Amycolatopsis acidiphila]
MARVAPSARSRVPDWVEPMLAKPDGGRLRSGPGWAYEYKLDGYRCAMRIAPSGTTVLTSRNGIDFTDEFPTLAGALGVALGGRAAVLDGEIVACNEAGQIEFGLLQERRGRYQKYRTAGHHEPFEDARVRFLAFDLLQLGDTRLLEQPYDERRRLLAALPMPAPDRVSIVPAFTFDELAGDGLTPQDLLDRAGSEGYEGLIAKLRSSIYVPGHRPDAWLKHPLIQTQEVILCGWRPGQRGFTGTLGSLLLGAHDPGTGDLVYLGDVGTGFSRHERAELQARLEELERRTHPFATAPPREDVVRAHWVEPVLVGEVQYRQFTRGAGRLRHTSWRGLRADRSPDEVIAPRAVEPAAAPPPPAKRITVQAGKRRLTLSNLDKPLYPDGFTKGEVINYYSHIAPVLLPHLAGRPVTFIRFPDGVGGQQFFEKNVAKGAPDWLRTVVLPSSGSRGNGDSVEYALIEELAALVWAANMAALELHVPQWKVGREAKARHPDRLVFDLDPGEGTTIVECCRVAERLHDALVADGLTPYAKTSGSKGMQVCAGIRTRSPRAPSAYAKALAEQFAAQTPALVTAKMAKALRPGKVFIDWSQNNPAKTTIAAYSLRGRDRPTVSTPLTWDEVRACRRAAELVFTADDVLGRVEDLGDLMAGIDDTRARLPNRLPDGHRTAS